MSSPPQLQLSLPPNTTSFKRSFEQFGFDLESPASTLPHSHEPIDGTSSTASSSSSSTRSPDGDENRRKRARSASSLSEPEGRSSDASSSTLSSFDSENASDSFSHSSSSQAARRHLLLDLGLGRGLGSSVALGLGMAAAELQLGGRGSSEPPPRIPTPELLESEDVDMPDIDMDFSRHEEPEEGPVSPAEHVRRSVDRFNAFDRHISVLRSSSPPVIPLPTSLSSRQASLSPPTLPPLPLVDLGLDPEDDEDGDEPENIPSSVPTNASTPPRLDLNLPPTTSLSPGPSSPHVTTDETSTQFRERLDSAIDGLGGGDLHFEAPISPPTAADGPSFDRYFEPVREALTSASDASAIASAPTHRSRPLVESSLFDWSPSTLDWNPPFPARSPGGSGEAAQPLRSPSLAPWRPPFRPPHNNTTAATDTTAADIRRLIGNSAQPPRLYPRPASLAAPLSVPATSSSLDAGGLDGELVNAYLDLRRNNSNTRAWESALDRARALHEQRERERERERERVREREQHERDREREREIAREREEESERERERPWSLDSIWETNATGVESFPSSARPRPWESLMSRSRREIAEHERELELAITRRRTMERQLQQTLDRERERQQRDEQHEAGQSSLSRAARYLESGLVDPREAPVNTSGPPREHRLRPPSDTSNPFNVHWASRRSARLGEDEGSSSRPRVRRSRSSSQSREGAPNWLGRIEHEESPIHFDLLDEWLSDHPPSRSVTPRTGASPSGTYDEREGLDYSRRPGESSTSSGEAWQPRAHVPWQPRLALSPQSTAQPTRTATHARAQSIPTSSLSSLSSSTTQPSIHRLRSRLHGPPRAAGVGTANSLVAENAAAIRRREARSELMERLNRTMSMDIDALSDPESDWEPLMARRARNPQPVAEPDDEMDSEDDEPHLRRRVAEAFELIGSRPPVPRRLMRFPRQPSPPRELPPLPLRVPSGSLRPRPSSATFEREPEEELTASSSGLNSRRLLPIHPRRPIVRLRQHPISGEISPPSATASVDRRHVSWEAPSRDAGVSNTYQYLSALSHGFDSQALSISDLAHTIASNSNNEAARTPPSPMWGENESPFSTLFARSAGPSPSLTRTAPNTRGQETARESSVPSLPPPDLGGDFDRTEDMIRSANAEGLRATVATPMPESPTTLHPARPPTPPSNNPYTGPFRLTMQRREEFRRAGAQRRVPEPPSIPPLYFGGDFEPSSPVPPSQEGSDSRHRLLTHLGSHRPQSYQGPSYRSELSSSARLAEAERRLLNYRGPGPSSQTSDGDPRRFFPSRPTPTSSTSHVDRDSEEQQQHGRRYSATDMHNVLARQARLEGSRLATDSSPYRTTRGDTDSGTDLSLDGFSASSRAHRLISRYHEQAEAEARESSTSTSPWAALPARRSEANIRADVDARRRRLMATRPEAEPPQMRHRAFRDPSFHAMFGLHGATARFRRRALGDYMRDEDFDGSYETLLSLGGMIGDAKPKATPDHVLAGLETASYKDWATSESDQRCPICLDDYQPTDPVLKLGDCRHWLHKECLEQWLKGASTCPVCRKDVKGKARRAPHRHHPGSDPSRRRDGHGPDGPGGPGTSGGGSGSGGDIPHINWLNFLRD